MELILLEPIPRLGRMGDTVVVRNGYARNYLLPRGKALRANAENRARFQGMREELALRNAKAMADAESLAEVLADITLVAIRQASETGQLYGSVSSRDIAAMLQEKDFRVGRSQVVLNHAVKSIGLQTVPLQLHGDVRINLRLNVARSEEEAERQEAGEDLTVLADDRDLAENDADLQADAEQEDLARGDQTIDSDARPAPQQADPSGAPVSSPDAGVDSADPEARDLTAAS